MQDVADAAGVSRMAVSYALRDDPKVSSATRRRIKRLAEGMGYTPDPLIQHLSTHLANARRSPHSGCIGYLTTDVSRGDWRGVPAYRKSFAALSERAGDLGYRVEEFWLGEAGMNASKLSRILKHRGVRGIVVAPIPGGVRPPRMRWEDFACIALGYSMRVPALTRVVSHQLHVGMEAIRRVGLLGYRRIGLCVSRDQNDRVDHAWLHAVRFHHASQPLAGRVLPHVPAVLTRENILQWVERERPDCILVQDQSIRWHLRDAGYDVPGDIGVVMLDHDAETEAELAGMNQRHDRIGVACVETLVSQIHRNDTGLPEAPLTVMIDGLWVPGATVRAMTPARRKTK